MAAKSSNETGPGYIRFNTDRAGGSICCRGILWMKAFTAEAAASTSAMVSRGMILTSMCWCW